MLAVWKAKVTAIIQWRRLKAQNLVLKLDQRNIIMLVDLVQRMDYNAGEASACGAASEGSAPGGNKAGRGAIIIRGEDNL
jgi:hypothetical protein